MNSIIILCAKDLIYLTALLGVVYWILLKTDQKKHFVIFGAVTAISSYILAKIGGLLFYNARPFASEHLTPLIQHAASNGFPSSHTLLAAVIAVTIFAISKKWGIGFMVLAIIIGASRVAANVHHPIDIIGSIVFAVVGGILAHYLTPKIENFFQKNRHKKA
jgi:undecaprenyl-diphosphatase